MGSRPEQGGRAGSRVADVSRFGGMGMQSDGQAGSSIGLTRRGFSSNSAQEELVSEKPK